jgi:hypothetical protein
MELHGVLRSRPVQGIEERLTVELGLRTPTIWWSPATLIRCLRWGRVRFLALGALPRHMETLSRVGRGREWLGWLVYGGGFSGGRWHAVHRANAGELALRRGWERAGAYGRSLDWLYRCERGQGHGFSLAQCGVRGAERRGVLWRCQGASNTWSFVSAPFQTFAEIANVRILPCVLRRTLPGT